MEGICPHCNGKTWAETDGYVQIQPAICDNGCGEFYDQTAAVKATDQEVLAGWHCGPGIESQIEVDPGDDAQVAIIAAIREGGRQLLEQQMEQDRLFIEKAAAFKAEQEAKAAKIQKYIDEALF